MTEPTAATAAPAQSTEQTSAQPSDYAAYEREQTARDLGREVPEPVKPAVAAADADDDDEPAAPIEAKAGQPAKPLSKRQQQINDLIREKTERDLEIARLKGQIEARGADPAKPKLEEPTKPAEDKEPSIDDFLTEPDPYLSLTRAYAKWEARQERKAWEAEQAAKTQKDSAQTAIEKVFTDYQTRETAFKATVPDFDARTLAFRKILDLRQPLDQAVITSEVAPQLILHLAEHQTDVERIARLAQTNLPAALRELGKLEAKFDLAETPAPAQPAATTTKTVTSAPPPPTTLGTRPAEPADDVAGAVARNDFSAYERAANKRDLAAAGRR